MTRSPIRNAVRAFVRVIASRVPTAVAAFLTLHGPLPAQTRDAEGMEFFEKEIRPVLADKCFRCHGLEKQKGGLRLDSRESAKRGGDTGPAIVEGKTEGSLLVQAIRRKGDLKMPPDAPLGEGQVKAFEKWIERGAPWPDDRKGPPRTVTDHWAFQPVREPLPPALRDASRVRSPVDRFIFAKLEAVNRVPSPDADRRTLIRRATYDLTGLPPTPAEVDAFLADESPDAYGKLIDRLLASPRYGEQWGRHWLDVARYSDTKGYVYAREERFWVSAWTYRDWVVKALNEDMPYDRFLSLQLAADLEKPDDTAARAAMGYLTLGRRFLGVTHDIIDDRIDVVTRGMLGLTVACARCHSHKFDPIPTEDYYALYGIFRGSTEQLLPLAPPDPRAPGAAEFAKKYKVAEAKYAEATAKARGEAADRVRGRATDYLQAQWELHKYPEEGFDVFLLPDDIYPAYVRRWRDHLKRADKRSDPVFAAWHAFAEIPPADFAARSAWIAESLRDIPGINPLVLKAFAEPPDSRAEVARRYGMLFEGIAKQWSGRKKDATKLDDPAAEALRQVLYGKDSPCEVPEEDLVDTETYFPTKLLDQLWKLRKDLDRLLIESPAAPPQALAMADRAEPVNAPVFRRGNPATPAGEVPRHFLTVLAGGDPKPFGQGSGRRELAKAIVDPANPLTARVLVNRVWMHHFGAGLVRTPSDFGTRAEPPTHPELLDWLAARFVAEGWSLKKLHRTIMLSTTYRQSSQAADETDPDNRLLGRMNARKLSFEEIRDSLYSVSGELDETIGGKPVQLFSKPFPRRRTIYGEVDREYFPGLLRAFDFANPDIHVAQRSDTTVPQQSLFWLNHPMVLDRARALAAHNSVASETTDEGRAARLFRLVHQRDATPSQLRGAVSLLQAAGRENAPPVKSDWSYGYGSFDAEKGKLTGFTPLPHFTGESWQGGTAWPDGKLGWLRLTAEGGHPDKQAVVRRWTAPYPATIQVRSTLGHTATRGDGVRGTILSDRQGKLKEAVAHGASVEIALKSVKVAAGEAIDFVVDMRDGIASDDFTWAPTVIAVRENGLKNEWDARSGFAGPVAPLTPLGQLAQVLLMANEFSFVD